MGLPLLLSELEANKVDYGLVKEKLQSFVVNTDYSVVNIVIPIMGRKEFLPPLYNSLSKAIQNVDITVNITVVEISDESEHKDYCSSVNINYFWLDINLLVSENSVFKKGFNGFKMFNKSLAMNIGATQSPPSKYLLFHDVDCLVRSDFFNNLLENVRIKDAKAIQCFQRRRVLNISEVITKRLISSELEIDDINEGTEGVAVPKEVGAPGGSILVESDVFYEIGGYDPELFSGYSLEDAFFWHKLELLCIVHSSDNPPIDIFHLHHTSERNSNQLFDKMYNFCLIFGNLPITDRIRFIKLKQLNFKPMRKEIQDIILNSVETKLRLIKGTEHINRVVDVCIAALKNGNSIYWCGNGGSAADAQHLSAELSGRFYYDRDPLPSEALHCNTSYITAVANDYSYESIYSRLIKGIGKQGDILIGLSTSGKSKNVVNAFNEAKTVGMITIGFTGEDGNDFETCCDVILNVPSTDTPRIQECHMLVGHIICELIEKEMFPK